VCLTTRPPKFERMASAAGNAVVPSRARSVIHPETSTLRSADHPASRSIPVVSGEGRSASSSWPLRRTSAPIDRSIVLGEWKKLATAQRDQIKSAAPVVPEQVHVTFEGGDDAPVLEHGEHGTARELTQWAGG
jgi:hypothetical protein